MRKVISAAIEEVMLILYLVWVGRNFLGRFTSVEQLWIMGVITVIAIAIAKAIEVLIDYKFGKKEKEFQRVELIKRSVLCFVLTSLIFFLAFNAMEYFGNMPATNRTLLIISIGFAFSHLLISYVLDVLLGLNKESLKITFHEEFIEDDLNDET